jgi:hypothetical protein
MVRLQLDERQWLRVKAALGVRKRAGRPGRDDRNFVEAVLCSFLVGVWGCGGGR